jgi:threonylcarbamoyladenosine tRNA methylthiotransferase MtaB
MSKVAIHNLGCKVNSYEAQSMEQLLKKAGFDIVPFNEDTIADIYIINTCSVTNIADRKSRQMLHKAKKMNPDAIVIAAGCYVNADAKKAAEDSAVDIVLGNNNKINIVETINQYYIDHGRNSAVCDINKEAEYENLSIEETGEHTRAYIKIQDGCNQFCSYCIIPYTRGRIRSRDLSDIVAEVETLADKGYKEVVLTGIHLSSYGLDSGRGSLLDVIMNLSEIEKLERIRLGSLEPRIITEEFVSALSSNKKLCPHFHLSLQSGCDTVLKRMNRRYDTAEYFEKCELLRKYFDSPAITTDVIVGFPGETDDEFEVTREFLEKVAFYEVHVFKFSRRKGTVADRLPNQIDEKGKTVRSNVLLSLTAEMKMNYIKSHIGRSESVLVEEKSIIDGTEYAYGYTPDYIRVRFASDDDVKINESYSVSLLAVDSLGVVMGNITNLCH